MLNIEKQYESLPWLTAQQTQLARLVEAGRCPHAILIQGQAGTGRRQLAIWLAEMLLGSPLELANADPDTRQVHPDLLIIGVRPDKTEISVDQIRELIEFTRLTSHLDGRRCAIIYPAERMNKNGFNSLLKTLEEPPAGVVLMLVCESLSRVPPTVVSRSQRLRVPVPEPALALEWLASQTDEPDIEAILSFTSGAPLGALDMCRSDFAEQTRIFSSDIESLMLRQADPVRVAANWAKQADLAVRWLYWLVAGEIRSALAENAPAEASFRKLDQIRELRRFIHSGVSAELSLTGLLMEWYGAGGPDGK